jgi:hypothetical protein
MFEFYYPETILNESSIWSSLFVTLIGTFIGFLGAFYLVNRSLTKQRRIDRNKKHEELKDRLSFFSLLIDNSLSTTKNQLENFEILAVDIKSNPIELNLLPIVASIDLDRLQKIDSNEIFTAYNELIPNSESKLKDYKNLYNSIDYISLRINQAFNSNEKHISFLHKDQLYIKEMIENLSDELIKEIYNIEKSDDKYKQNPTYIFLTQSHEKYYDMVENQANLSLIETKFLNPFAQDLQKNRLYESYPKLFHYTSKSMIRFAHIKMNSINFSNELSGIRNEMTAAINSLNENNEKLKRALTKAKFHGH